MFPRGLKPGIITNLVLLITAAMILVDLVMLGTLRQELLRSQRDKGLAFLAIAAPLFVDHSENPDSQYLSDAMKEAEATCLLVLNEEGQNIIMTGENCDSQSRMRRKAGDSLSTGESDSIFYGRTWGILFSGRKSLVVSYPFVNANGVRNSAAIELSLNSYHEALRNSQRVFAVYFLINLLVLSLLGFHRLYRTLVKPINNLVSTAEKFNDNEEFSFSQNTKEGEFNILSRSLNKMLSRIKDDRQKLEESVRSLEKTNEDLQKAQLEVVRAEKLASVGRLSAGIAHEIGNPVGIVLGYLDLLKQDKISSEQKKEFVERTELEVQRINTIIRQLLDFARQPQDDPYEFIRVHKVIQEVEDICKVQPLMAGITITTELVASDDQVFATTGQLKQIFINLLINGADAINSMGSTDGRIKISTQSIKLGNKNKPSIKVTIEDNGPGIEPEQLQNIFDPFYTTKEPGKGTGLGLSICFTMVEALGGSITADTAKGGMTITINLPLTLQQRELDEESKKNG